MTGLGHVLTEHAGSFLVTAGLLPSASGASSKGNNVRHFAQAGTSSDEICGFASSTCQDLAWVVQQDVQALLATSQPKQGSSSEAFLVHCLQL